MSNQNNINAAKICSIKDIENFTFEIPPYQRLYDWQKENIQTLLNDFAADKNKPYFIGNVVVAKSGDKHLLIDGQQRLTTIWLLLKHLGSECFNISMPIREAEAKAIEKYKEGADLNKLFSGEINPNIKNAFEVFRSFKGEIDAYFIKNNVKFNLVTLSDKVQVNQYFVRLNSAGVQLDATDILKARLLKRIADSEEDVARYAAIWDECSQMQYFAEFGDKNSSAVLDPKKISEIIADNQALENHTSIQKEREEFKSIIDFPTFVLHVFKILFGDEVKINKSKFLENTWEIFNKQSEISAKDVLEALQKYCLVFDKFVIKKKKGDDDYYYFYTKDKNNHYSPNSELTELAIMQNYLRVARTGENRNYHHFLTKYLEFCRDKDGCELNEKNAKECLEFLKNIDDFLAIKQLENCTDLVGSLSDFMNQPSYRESIDFTFLNKGTATPHYWFYRLEYYLLQEKYKDKNYRFRHVNSIEHIYAQNEKFSEELFCENINDFANLALITDGENSKFGNNSINEKKKIFDKLNKENGNRIINLKLNHFYDLLDTNKSNDHEKQMLEILQKSFLNKDELL